MSIGNFNETKDVNSEMKETKENVDNTEKTKNQVIEKVDRYDDGFEKKLDSIETNESGMENNDNKEAGMNEMEKKSKVY